MKKVVFLFLAVFSLCLFVIPVHAAASSTSPAPNDGGAENTPAPVVDVPVDESTYEEEPAAPYVPAQRLPGRGEIEDILQYWEENGYPADVSYVFEAGGEVVGDQVIGWWEIGLVGADEARRQEILDLVAPNCLVEFRNCLFTHAQKQRAYDTITELAVSDPNIQEVVFIRNDDTVWVAVPEELAKDYAQYLIRDLGLGAVVSVTDCRSLNSVMDLQMGIINGVMTPGGVTQTTPQTFTGGLVPTAPSPAPSPMFWACLALAVFAACAVTVLALRRRFVPAAVTAEGAVRAASAPLTRAQAEQAVKEGLEAPDSGLYQAILDEADGK